MILRVNEFLQHYTCLPCSFDLGTQEAQRRSREELNLKPCQDSTSSATDADSSEK